VSTMQALSLFVGCQLTLCHAYASALQYKGVTTSELDELAAETAAHLMSLHPDYGLLAARIAVSNLHKDTLKSFSDTAKLLYNYINPKTGQQAPMISDKVFQFIIENRHALNAAIVYDRDYSYDYFGFKVSWCAMTVSTCLPGVCVLTPGA